MPPIGTLSVGVWTIRFREKWNMVKIDDPQRNPWTEHRPLKHGSVRGLGWSVGVKVPGIQITPAEARGLWTERHFQCSVHGIRVYNPGLLQLPMEVLSIIPP
jgi:hypothetical protein